MMWVCAWRLSGSQPLYGIIRIRKHPRLNITQRLHDIKTTGDENCGLKIFWACFGDDGRISRKRKMDIRANNLCLFSALRQRDQNWFLWSVSVIK